MKIQSSTFALPLFLALVSAPVTLLAVPILGSDVSSFAVLGASTVTNTGATTLTGELGVFPGLAATGLASVIVNGQPALTTGAVYVHAGDALAAAAQSELSSARTNLGLLGPGALLGADLSGLTLTPGVYTVPAGVSNLTTLLGALTLDGLGNANAAWVFQMTSTLITSPGSVVKIINTGSGAGLYWVVGSSATIDTSTVFQGNILALTSISLNNGAMIGCGRALADTGAVTMDHNFIDNFCSGAAAGSNGLSGGISVATGASGETPTFLPFAPLVALPEPASWMLVGIGLAGFAARLRRKI